jgi:hypothetical protein
MFFITSEFAAMPLPSFRVHEDESTVVVKVSLQGLSDASNLECYLNDTSLSVQDGSGRFTAVIIQLPDYPVHVHDKGGGPNRGVASWKGGGFKAKYSKKRAELSVTLPKPPPPPPQAHVETVVVPSIASTPSSSSSSSSSSLDPKTEALLAVDPVTEASLAAAARACDLPPSLAKVETKVRY